MYSAKVISYDTINALTTQQIKGVLSLLDNRKSLVFLFNCWLKWTFLSILLNVFNKYITQMIRKIHIKSH